MSITPAGNINFINQNAPVVSASTANTQARLDMQNTMAAELANETKDEIAELRPAEETYKIDPENQHEKQKNQQEQENNQSNLKKNDEIEQEISENENSYHLDIKI
ncbi:hypothetical protein BFG04_05765 [Campylobacter pinnipediorum subsp. pinnipediorum]|uniref:Uncharacterized protein n=1 Tax=Campylobacter pinnipediorum subsp. pinnipediorum TaxID=1660067 RepID=A0AAX0L8P0_9BACT|nr:hypothetical protein [Campylobacter pinnipediorum]OPA74979.1 hypothetical protein BFG05_06955 [Campylobacter pinnipediorum subsp. pinnipediorum]OPA74993.1 hypothetical protein BFG04_05765 [Campylobacter pinnipediorum subsp. pinnipediorum]